MERPLRASKHSNYETIELAESIDESILTHIVDHAKELFLQKNLDWRDEAEFRLLLIQLKADSSPVYVDIKKSLNGVIVGSEYEESQLEPLIEHAKEMDFCVGQMQWQDGNGYVGRTPYPAIDSEGHYSDNAYYFANVDFYTKSG